MKYKIFDSNDQDALRDEYFENWEKYFPDEEKPMSANDLRLARKAAEYIQHRYDDILWSFKSNSIPGDLLLLGSGKCWSGGYVDIADIVSPEEALEWNRNGWLAIHYEDGEIIITRDNGDDCEDYLRLLIVKPYDSIDQTGLTSEWKWFLYDFYIDEALSYMSASIWDEGLVYASTAPYFEKFLNDDALKDLNDRRANKPAHYYVQEVANG